MKPTLPLIHDYRDPVLFLSDWFRARKEQDSGFSIRTFAAEAGFKNPAGLIALLRKEKRIKLKHFEMLNGALKLDPTDQLFFKAMMLLDGADTDSEREMFELLLAHLAPLSRAGVNRLTEDGLFSHWLDGAILSLCQLDPNDLREEDVLRFFSNKADAVAIRDSLHKLIRLRLIAQDHTGALKRQPAEVSTPTDVPISTISSYYKQVSGLAQDAADLPVDEREFQCFAIDMKRRDLPLVKEMIRNFRLQLKNACGRGADSVYQVNLQCFPLGTRERRSEPKETLHPPEALQ